MAESSNPATPSRFDMGGQRFSRFVPEDDGYRPPTLTAQGREDVERLRAKVRKHNPGYIYTNGVSLPSQLPSVPELLDELASHVRSARTDQSIPNTPLPEVETSELAKAGFDWKAIADCAIEALETGSRRPLPLANDPAAAEIPGLDIIAASRATTTPPPPPAEQATQPQPEAAPEMPEESEPETVPEAAPATPADWESSEATWTETAPAPADAAQPLAPEVGVPLTHAPDMATSETEVPEEVLPLLGEPMAPAEPAADTDAPVPDQELPESEAPEAAQEVTELWSEPEELAAIDAEEIEISEELPEQLPQDLAEELPEDLLEQLPEEISEELPEQLPEELPVEPAEGESTEQTLAAEISAVEDLVSQRVYDDDVLESEGNDDELFVGDVEGEVAHWEVNPEEAPEVPSLEPDQLAATSDEAPAEVASETELEANLEQTELPEGAEVAEELPAAALLEETEINEPQLETELTLQDSASAESADEATPELSEETPVEDLEAADIPETDLLAELPEGLPEDLPEELPEELPEQVPDLSAAHIGEDFTETDVDLADLDLGELEDLEPELETTELELTELETTELETTEEPGLDEPLEEPAGTDTENQVEPADEIPVELPEDLQTAEETALPGSEAIGMEEPEPDSPQDSDAVNLEEVDSVVDSESEVFFAAPTTTSDEMTGNDTVAENEESEPNAADLPYLGENAEDMLVQADGAEHDASEEELPFEIPQVQGDIPEAMQEGFPEWEPTMSSEAAPGADEELFAAGGQNGPAEAEPAKQGFFSKLFSKKSKKAR